jgi:peptidoglycan hydrolase-like protein with peptidoglycan-binding domain
VRRGSEAARVPARSRDVADRRGPAAAGRTPEPAADPRSFGAYTAPSAVLGLQRSAGNSAVTSLVRGSLLVQRAGAGTATPAAPPWAASTRPVLKVGEGPSTIIGELQQALNSAVPGGTALRVTGMFDADTEAKVNQFQKSKPELQANGIANKKTWWFLDQAAPRVVRQGRGTVEGPGGGDARGTPNLGTIHPTIKLGSKGPAVEELQQKLNTVPSKEVTIWVSDHGKFDKTTKIAVVEFQKSRTPPQKGNGVVGKATWAALDAVAGPVKVGRESYDWSQRAEGTITGSGSRFTWRLLDDRLEITVNIKFTGATKDPMVAQWRKDITDIWNSFKFVDGSPGPGKAKELLLDFVVGSGSPTDASIKVHKTPAKAKKIPRSDAANWHTGDKDKGLAPHEFGHLIGLQDEYNKGPEVYTVVTGEQPRIGEVAEPADGKGGKVSPEVVAAEMRKAVSGNAATRGKRAVAVVRKYSLTQGGFAQRVALAYEKANAGKLLREDFNSSVGYKSVKDPAGSMGNDLAARIPGRFGDAPDEAEVLEPFLYTNAGIMGSMEGVNTATTADAHNHPVAERHIRHFLQIVQSNKPGSWRTSRR